MSNNSTVRPGFEGIVRANERLRKRALAAQVRHGHDTIGMVTAMRRRKLADKQTRTIAELRAMLRAAVNALHAAGVRVPKACRGAVTDRRAVGAGGTRGRQRAGSDSGRGSGGDGGVGS